MTTCPLFFAERSPLPDHSRKVNIIFRLSFHPKKPHDAI
jgi:hypothetical protein